MGFIDNGSMVLAKIISNDVLTQSAIFTLVLFMIHNMFYTFIQNIKN